WSTFRVPRPVAKIGAWVRGHLPFGDDGSVRPWMIDRAGDHYALDVSRARRLLGWKPRHSLQATLPLMVAALKESPRGWYREHGLEARAHREDPAHPAQGRGGAIRRVDPDAGGAETGGVGWHCSLASSAPPLRSTARGAAKRRVTSTPRPTPAAARPPPRP